MAKVIVIAFHLLMVLHYGYSIKFYLLDPVGAAQMAPPEHLRVVDGDALQNGAEHIPWRHNKQR